MKQVDSEHGLCEDHAAWNRMLASMDAELGADPKLQATVPLMMAGRPGLDLRGYVQGRFGAPGAGARTGPKFAVELDGGGSPSAFAAEIGRDGRRGRAAFAMANDLPVCVGATCEGGRFAVSVLYPFIRALYPGLSMAFLSSAEIKSALDELDGAGRGEVIVDSYASKSKLDDEKPGPARTAESAMRRTGRPYREAFEADGGSIDRVRFRLIESGKSVLEGQMSRNGILMFRGSFLPFEGAMRQIVKTVSDKANLYSNRSRSENDGKVRPLVIEVAESPFKNAAEGKRLISVIESMPRTSSSLYHSDSYIRMFLVDFRDGSSFDIWVVSDGEVTIVPQIRATTAAVARLTAHIMKEFREGRVREHEQSEA